jgi:hypothetical protein
MGIWVDDTQYNNTPFYIPPYNQLGAPSNNHTTLNPTATQPNPTQDEPTTALQDEPHKCARAECAQPPSTLSAPTTSANPTTARPGRTTKDQPGVLEDNREGSEEEEQQRHGTDERTTTETQRDQHNGNASVQCPLLPFKCDAHTTMNDYDVYVMSLGQHEEPCGSAAS